MGGLGGDCTYVNVNLFGLPWKYSNLKEKNKKINDGKGSGGVSIGQS